MHSFRLCRSLYRKNWLHIGSPQAHERRLRRFSRSWKAAAGCKSCLVIARQGEIHERPIKLVAMVGQHRERQPLPQKVEHCCL
jgi:hypothetical protein